MSIHSASIQFLIGLVLSLLFSSKVLGQATVTLDSTILTEREVAIGIQVPWEIIWGPDDFIWATERRGRVLRINPSTGNVVTVLNIQAFVESGGEPGLLGMAMYPNFVDTPWVYLVYNYPGGSTGIAEKIVRYTWNGTTLATPITIMDNIGGGGIHNGSRLLITPDRKLLATTGDIGSGNLSQNLTNLNGKLLRMNLDGTIPSDNPTPNSYIYSYGHRNAQGLAFGPNGKLYSSEHGAQQSDEFNLIEPNRNYGWPTVQGACNTNAEITFCTNNNVKEPLIEFSPCVAVNGIEYYDHPAIPEWKGKMLMAVLGGFVVDPRLSVLELNTDGTAVLSEKKYFANYGRLRDICINPQNGAIYLATNGPSYPGSGPNRIIEYRNLAYSPSNTQNPFGDQTQFLTVAPNPSTSEQGVMLRCSPSFVGQTYQIFGFDTKLVAEGQITGTEMRVEMQNLPKASYYLVATNESGTIAQKIIIQ